MERLNASTFNQLQKEAEQGNPQAQYALGGAYYNGNGTARNPVEGARWLLKAAENGYAPAQCDLGVMYEKGAGVEQSYKDTLKWYCTAAEQGDALAQHNLGTLYTKGFRDRSVGFFLRVRFASATRDYVEAYKWFSLAATNGYTRSLKDRSFIEKRMTVPQIARAQQLVHEFEREMKGGGDKNGSSKAKSEKRVIAGPSNIDGGISRVVALGDGTGRVETWKPGTGWVESGASPDEFIGAKPVSAALAARMGIPASELGTMPSRPSGPIRELSLQVNSKPRPSGPQSSQPGSEPSLQQKLDQAKRDYQKWSAVAASPDLSPQAAAWARDAARSYGAAARLYEKGLTYQEKINSVESPQPLSPQAKLPKSTPTGLPAPKPFWTERKPTSGASLEERNEERSDQALIELLERRQQRKSPKP